MSDLINRKELIETIELRIVHHIKDAKDFTGEDISYNAEELFLRLADECGAIIEIIGNQPSAEPARGEWIKTFRYMSENVNTGNIEPVYRYDCPVCAWHTGNQGGRFNFCPNCGADMRKKVD